MNPLSTQNINPQTVLLRVYGYFHHFYFPKKAFQFGSTFNWGNTSKKSFLSSCLIHHLRIPIEVTHPGVSLRADPPVLF